MKIENNNATIENQKYCIVQFVYSETIDSYDTLTVENIRVYARILSRASQTTVSTQFQMFKFESCFRIMIFAQLTTIRQVFYLHKNIRQLAFTSSQRNIQERLAKGRVFLTMECVSMKQKHCCCAVMQCLHGMYA
jgi:hypothetical protein